MKKYKKDISVVKEEFEGFSKDSELTNEQKERRIAEL